MNYALGFVSGFEVTLPFFDSVFKAAVKDHCSVLSMLSGPLLHRARNELSSRYLKTTTEPTLLMVDSDIVFTTDDVDAIMAHDSPAVSGVYVDGHGETVTDGCGFLRIDREVLEKLMPYPFNPIKVQDGRVSGEDVGFRFHAKEAGFDVVVDHSISVGHVKPHVMRVEAPAPELVLAR